MRVTIVLTPTPFGEPATSFDCGKHRIVSGNIASELSFYGASGQLLSRQNKVLPADKYSEWCETDEDSNDDEFFTNAHAVALGLEIVVPEPAPPPEPPIPPTAEEIEAQRQSDIAALTDQIAALQAQIDALNL